MKGWYMIIAAMLGALNADAQHSLEVEVVLSKPGAGGQLHIALCPSERSFDMEEGCTVRTVPAVGGSVHVTFNVPQEGHHALKVFHDVNGNGRIDTNWMGIPKEPYGFGNDAMGSFGPPTWEQARIMVRGATSTRLRLRG